MADPQAAYDVLATPEARRHLDALPEKVLRAALALIHGALAKHSRRVDKPLVGELHSLSSARRSDYRVIYEIDDLNHAVIIHRVQHRRDVYRSR